MIFSLIRSGLVFSITSSINTVLEANHDTSKNYVFEERVFKSIIGEIILDLQHKNIEKVFHLPRVD